MTNGTGARIPWLNRLVFSASVVVFLALVGRNIWLQRHLSALRENPESASAAGQLVSGDAVLRLKLSKDGKAVDIGAVLGNERTIFCVVSPHCRSCAHELELWSDYRKLHPSDRAVLVRHAAARSSDSLLSLPADGLEYELVRSAFSDERLSVLPQLLVVDSCGIVRASFRSVHELEAQRSVWVGGVR